MKGKLLIVLVLVVIFAGIVGVRMIFLSSQSDTGRLKIVSSPSASVFLDNVPLGKTPYEDKYKAGEYQIKLIPDGDSSQSATYAEKIKVYKNALTYVNRELGTNDISSAGEVYTITKMETKPKNSQYGEVYVETDPAGSIVYLDNDEKGVAPLILSDVLRGDHELSIFMPGFIKRTQKLNVEGEYRVNASVKLAIDPATQPHDFVPSSPSAQLSTSPSIGTSTTATPTPTPGSVAAANAGAKVLIKDTPTGWLRVREEPTVNASESGRVNPGDTFPLLEEKSNWYKIRYDNKDGWISSQYATKQ